MTNGAVNKEKYAIKLPHRRFWHPTMHAAVLVAELRADRQEDQRLPPLPHELSLPILEFVPHHELGAPPPPAV